MLKFEFQKRGFTLVETLIAITLITVGLVGAVSLITYAISNTAFIRGKLLASQLAQEGIEVVRNMRDNNWLAGKITDPGWREGLGDGTYVAVFSDNPAEEWSLAVRTADNQRVFLFNNTETGEKFYGQQENFPSGSGWTKKETSFERWVELAYDEGTGGVKITSHVKWRERGRTHDFEIEDYLYNWQVGVEVCPLDYILREGYGKSTGTSYYAGGLSIGDGPCTGQEIALLGESPFRSFSQNLCVKTGDLIQSYTYCSKRSSSAICEVLGSCLNTQIGDQVELIVDPF